jgi:hypothetical protein
MPCQRQLELTLRVEAAGGGGNFLPQQAIGADDPSVIRAGKRSVEDEQMVANLIEAIGVATLRGVYVGLPCAKFFVEDPVADFLRCGDLGSIARQTNFQRSDASQHYWRERGSGVAASQHGACSSRTIFTLRQGCMHG